MISKYSYVSPKDALRQKLNIRKDAKAYYSYHYHPHKLAPIITQENPTSYELCHWGLIPHWSKTDNNRTNLINADINGLSSKLSFRLPFRQGRCIIPADSFYFKTKNGITNRFHLHDAEDIAIAGLYDNWNGKGSHIRSYTMITRRCNAGLANVIPTIPIILESKHIATWLNPTTSLSTLIELLSISKENLLRYYPITPQIDDLSFDDASLHHELRKEITLFS